MDLVTHQEAISTIRRGTPAEAPDRAAWDAALAHVGACSDCWSVLARVFRSTTGAAPSGAELMPGLFGCEEAQRQLYLLADVPIERMLVEQPRLVRHVARCHACRDRLADVMIAEDAVRRGEVEAWHLEPEPATWRSMITAVDEAVHELVQPVVVRVGREIADIVAGPAIATVPAGGGAFRRSDAATAASAGQRASVPLGDSGLVATMAIDAHGDGRVRVGVTVAGPRAKVMFAELHETRGDRLVLLAGERVADPGEVAFREVPPGSYLIELRELTPERRHRVHLQIDAGV
jgi:hypothetical protein